MNGHRDTPICEISSRTHLLVNGRGHIPLRIRAENNATLGPSNEACRASR
jgi:hypothetical protein